MKNKTNSLEYPFRDGQFCKSVSTRPRTSEFDSETSVTTVLKKNENVQNNN